jgi:hypothetical protein
MALVTVSRHFQKELLQMKLFKLNIQKMKTLVFSLFTTFCTQNLAAHSACPDLEITPGISQIDSLSSKDPIAPVLTAYLNLKNALAKDDESSTLESAKVLFKAIEGVDMSKFNPAQHKVWMTYAKKLSYDAEHIKGTKEMDHQREHFVSLSKAMHEVEKALNSNSMTLYYQFCPMANDGKGAYWLSETEKIKNPYMGKKMPSCGSTKETLNSAK